jgi:hypothetical protein
LAEHHHGVKRTVIIAEKNGGPVPGDAYKLPGPQEKLFVKLLVQDSWAASTEPGFYDNDGHGK